jgi:hypothetical protein
MQLVVAPCEGWAFGWRWMPHRLQRAGFKQGRDRLCDSRGEVSMAATDAHLSVGCRRRYWQHGFEELLALIRGLRSPLVAIAAEACYDACGHWRYCRRLLAEVGIVCPRRQRALVRRAECMTFARSYRQQVANLRRDTQV